MLRKTTCVVLALLLCLGALAACGSPNSSQQPVSAPSAAPASEKASGGDSTAVSPSADSSAGDSADSNGLEFVKLQIFMPGDMTARMRDFADNELKAKMKEDLNCELEFSYAPWGDYWNKLGLLLSTGEDIDFFWDGIGSLGNHYARKEVMPLDDLLQEYGQDLLKNIPIKNFDTAKMADGKIYAVPSQAAASSGKFYSVLVRQDLLEGVGMSKIETIADLEKFAELGKAAYPGKEGLVERTMCRAITRGLTDKNIAVWPLDGGELFWVDEDDPGSEVKCTFEADFFREYCRLMYEWIQKGYTTEQVMSDANELDRLWNQGNGLFRVGAVSRPLEEISKVLPSAPEAQLMEYFISPDKPRYIEYASNEAMSIPVNCKNPERVMMYLNWTLQSQENYNFLLFGVEGKDYTIENGRMNRIVQDDLIYEWMWRNNNYIIYPNTVTDDYIKACEVWDNGAPYSKLFGFNFDQEPVKVEKAAVEAEYAVYGDPLRYGLVEPTDAAFEEALTAFKNAGLDAYLAEVNRQLQEHNK